MDAQPIDLLPVPVTSTSPVLPAIAGTAAGRLIAAFLAGRSPATLRAY